MSDLSDKQLQERQEAARKHGLYAVRDRGEDAMTTPQRSRYQELKEQFDSEPGRESYRRELVIHLAMMLDIGFSDLQRTVERGGSIWNQPPVARMGTYLNTLVRLLDGWPKDDKGKQNITDVMARPVKQNAPGQAESNVSEEKVQNDG